jgi:hypothetical protein
MTFIDHVIIGPSPVQAFGVTTQGNYGTLDDNLLCRLEA